MKVLEFPLARITICFLLGILSAYFFVPNPNFIFGLLLLLLLLLCILFWGPKTNQKFKLYFSTVTYFTSFLIGMSSLIVQTDSFQKSNYTHLIDKFDKEISTTLVIREKLKNTKYNQRYIGIIQQIDQQNCNGRILLSIPKKHFKVFETGTILNIKGVIQRNKKPDNPNQFDYGAYLNQKQIYAQLYANSGNIKISPEPQKDIWYYISKINSKISHNLEQSHFDKTALAVASALILGQRQDISPEIIQDYQYAGAVHILSVSGLHVGFIFLFIKFLLSPIPNTRKGSLLKLSILLINLFLFALIAGLSPSIVRSVVMFSFVAIGLYFRRSVNIYHTLLVSILLILLFQAYFLFDVGFQLSYLAIFFIVWFQPILASYWKPKNKILKYCWDILTVSFAAQIGTLPLSLYYFHQFPGLFFITNLAVIPLLSIIMFLGVVVMSFAAIGFPPIWLSKPLEWSILFLNKIINLIASLEQFIIKDISFNFILLSCSYILIISTIIWLRKPQFNKLVLVLISIITMQSSLIFNRWNIQNQEEWIVFHSKRKTLIVQRFGNEVYLYTNDTASAKSKTLNSYLVGNFSHIQKQESLNHTAYFKGNKILILDSIGTFPKDIKPNIVLLTQTPKINLERMLLSLKPKLVIADGSNYQYILKLWKASCKKQKIPFHATAEKGFYKLD
ncbi:competence protein ComEC [Flavobacterium glycines]|uniref:Competence protein ComEC n=2 Tax=Flavobacterium glycines TaxID=551990 RepID=A0A1B9DMW7_9FLAO|nr:ComEC/Rec2 family competence protein [Flavobacterium glycines]OCB71042.1 competence protein ComEC [Flavobacterium glycines]SDI51163.1 competence protein ComEC [Flavobacterium glycines]